MTQRRRSYRLDRVFPGVGRINLVSGATTKTEHKKRDALLSELYDTGRLEVLRAIKNRKLTISEVFSARRTGSLGFAVTDVMLKRPLWDALQSWLPSSARSEATRKRYQVSVNMLRRQRILSDQATVRDLAEVDWQALFNEGAIGCRGRVGPTGWNHLRRTISHFLSMSLKGKHHPFRYETLQNFPIASEPRGRIPDLTPSGFWEVLAHVDEPLKPCFVALVATGMRPGEYLRCEDTDLMPGILGLRVPGTKTADSADVIQLDTETFEWVRRAIPCPVSHGILLRRWQRACEAAGRPRLRLYDLRHCHAQWLANAGVREAQIQQALRHRTPAMTRRYTTQRDRGENARAFTRIALNRPAVRPAMENRDEKQRAG